MGPESDLQEAVPHSSRWGPWLGGRAFLGPCSESCRRPLAPRAPCLKYPLQLTVWFPLRNEALAHREQKFGPWGPPRLAAPPLDDPLCFAGCKHCAPRPQALTGPSLYSLQAPGCQDHLFTHCGPDHSLLPRALSPSEPHLDRALWFIRCSSYKCWASAQLTLCAQATS